MLLVIDTCFNACSAALYDEGTASVVASGYQEMERGHAEALGPMVERLFAESNTKPNQLTRIAVTYGPGTFTGLRIGLSYAKGMALALDIPLVGLNSLKATAQHGSEKVIIAHKRAAPDYFIGRAPPAQRLAALTRSRRMRQGLVAASLDLELKAPKHFGLMPRYLQALRPALQTQVNP